MLQKLIQVGDQKAIILDQALLDQLHISEDDDLDVAADGDSIRLTPARIGIGPDRVDEHTQQLREQFGDTLKRLAE